MPYAWHCICGKYNRIRYSLRKYGNTSEGCGNSEQNCAEESNHHQIGVFHKNILECHCNKTPLLLQGDAEAAEEYHDLIGIDHDNYAEDQRKNCRQNAFLQHFLLALKTDSVSREHA